jgi:hypothetical protein
MGPAVPPARFPDYDRWPISAEGENAAARPTVDSRPESGQIIWNRPATPPGIVEVVDEVAP